MTRWLLLGGAVLSACGGGQEGEEFKDSMDGSDVDIADTDTDSDTDSDADTDADTDTDTDADSDTSDETGGSGTSTGGSGTPPGGSGGSVTSPPPGDSGTRP